MRGIVSATNRSCTRAKWRKPTERIQPIAATLVLVMVASVAVLAGCGSGDVTIRGRIVNGGEGVEGLWVVLADFESPMA